MNSIINRIVKNLKNPSAYLYVISNSGILDFLSDRIYIKLMFRLMMGYSLNLDNPQTFNEKIQWLKLNDRRPEYTTYVDKYAVREYIAKTIGEEYLIPLLGVWNSPDEIDFDKLPNQFVLKCNHDSGGLVICKDKSKLNIKGTKAKLNKCLKRDYYLACREWPYKNVPRKIIAEKYMFDDENKDYGLIDYKFSCFNGYVSDVMVCLDRQLNDTKFYFFDKDWNFLKLDKKRKEAPKNLNKPENIEKMFELSSILSKGFPYVRVDLYNCHGKIYFGELTFYPCSGFDQDLSSEADERWMKFLV